MVPHGFHLPSFHSDLGLPSPEAVPLAPPYGVEFLRLLGVVLGFLGMLLIGLHLARRFFRKPQDSPLIQVLGTHCLAPRQALLVVAVGEQRFLLASTQDRLEFLTPLAERELPQVKPGEETS